MMNCSLNNTSFSVGCGLLFWIMLNAFTCFTQNQNPALPISGDCHKAIQIQMNKATTYGPTVAPAGFGDIQEIDGFGSRGKLIEKEHHTAWYLINISHDAKFIFEIVPIDSSNDYDFVLFEYDSLSCNQIITGNLQPLRSNISRNDTSNKSITGLSGEVNHEFHGKGPGNQFSKYLEVKKDKKYLLVLDNVYDGGMGHTIRFNYIKDVVLEGRVLDISGKPLLANVSLSDYKGVEVAKTLTDTTGMYHLDLSLLDSLNYHLSISGDSFFISTHVINTIKLHNDSSHIHIKTILPKLKKGGKYALRNINFYGDMAILLPECIGSVESLHKLMKKNRKMKILIEGHVNAPGKKDGELITNHYYQLSLQRAQTVQNYLVNAGIAPDRISVIGLAATRMMYPEAKSEEEQKANRRVGIVVTSLYEE